MSKLLIRLINCSMVIIMVLFLVNTSINSHVHQLNNGTTIQHAHPFKKASDTDPIKHHQHSKWQLLYLQSIEIIFISTITAIGIKLSARKQCYGRGKAKILVIKKINRLLGRAPPVSFSI